MTKRAYMSAMTTLLSLDTTPRVIPPTSHPQTLAFTRPAGRAGAPTHTRFFFVQVETLACARTRFTLVLLTPACARRSLVSLDDLCVLTLTTPTTFHSLPVPPLLSPCLFRAAAVRGDQDIYISPNGALLLQKVVPTGLSAVSPSTEAFFPVLKADWNPSDVRAASAVLVMIEEEQFSVLYEDVFLFKRVSERDLP